jgi:hypothetical protein
VAISSKDLYSEEINYALNISLFFPPLYLPPSSLSSSLLPLAFVGSLGLSLAPTLREGEISFLAGSGGFGVALESWSSAPCAGSAGSKVAAGSAIGQRLAGSNLAHHQEDDDLQSYPKEEDI